MTSTARVGEDETLRLFLALRLPADVLEVLERWGEVELEDKRRPGLRRVPREHLHITLAFLGARPGRELPAIVDALGESAAAADAFDFETTGYRETRSVGMIALRDPSGAAGRLAADLHDRLERLRVYRREARTWLPHVTVVRFRERPMLRPAVPALDQFAPSDAAAFLSRLHPAGARYEVLAAVPLFQSRLGQSRLGQSRLGESGPEQSGKSAGGETERMR